eukprot:CAMPEP_0176500946 /NCGR_PEP_ID=MMETSP0200_2-20121128/13871_1 /TAXON_ID=947934 /ORGANISM="Chaetoceros sp., Strain GSL56" /LENGTH=247 /DNA_ID=CAMNT_0017899745 /DNA_START=182 /DNA_END=925 /DNA_ORIENTATION=+
MHNRTNEQNCDRYFGSQVSSSNNSNIAEKAVTKNDLCKEIVERIEQDIGISNRTVNSVRAKIDGLISAFKIADEFALNTGQGIKENEGEERFVECVKQRCAYYFGLLLVMQDRHSICPCFTTDFDNSSDDEESQDHIDSSGDALNTSMNSFADLSVMSSASAGASSASENRSSIEKRKAPAIEEAKVKARTLGNKSTKQRDSVSAALVEKIGITGKSTSHEMYMAKKSEMMDKCLERFDDKKDIAER